MATSKTPQSRVELVTEQLREEIFQGRHAPGTPLRELGLARKLNVSQATIREALRNLEHAGLITKEANRASTVTRLTSKEIKERVTLRALLEVLAAQAAAQRMGPDQFEALQQKLELLDSAVKSNNYYEAAQADLEFHRYIWQCSGNDTLCHTLSLITIPLFAFISILRSQGLQRLTTVVETHEPLIAALKSHDPGTIQTAFQQGATSSYQDFLEENESKALATALGLMQSQNWQ